MKISKQQLKRIIEEELNEIRLKIPLPRWAAKYATNVPKEEEPTADDGPGILDKVKQALSTDITPDSWKYDPYAERPLTAAEKRERAEKEKRDLRSQETGKRKEVERSARKAKRRVEMGITESKLKQIIREELEAILKEVELKSRDEAILKDGTKVKITGVVDASRPKQYLTAKHGRIYSNEIDHEATSKLNKKGK